MQGTFFHLSSSVAKVDSENPDPGSGHRKATFANLQFTGTVHLMRHSIATHLLDAGEPIDFVKDHLGHRSIESTLVYARISDRRRTRAIRRLERSLGV
jgi:integrase